MNRRARPSSASRQHWFLAAEPIRRRASSAQRAWSQCNPMAGCSTKNSRSSWNVGVAQIVTDPKQIAGRIDNGKFSHPPRLVAGRVHPGDTRCRKVEDAAALMKAIGVHDPQITARVVGRRIERTLEKEMDHQVAARENLVVAVHSSPAEPRPEADRLIERTGLVQVARRQDRL